MNLSIGGGQLGFALTAPPADQVHLDAVTNPLGLPTAAVLQAFAALEPGLFDQLGSLLPAFPLPQLVGLSLSPITTAWVRRLAVPLRQPQLATRRRGLVRLDHPEAWWRHGGHVPRCPDCAASADPAAVSSGQQQSSRACND